MYKLFKKLKLFLKERVTGRERKSIAWQSELTSYLSEVIKDPKNLVHNAIDKITEVDKLFKKRSSIVTNELSILALTLNDELNDEKTFDPVGIYHWDCNQCLSLHNKGKEIQAEIELSNLEDKAVLQIFKIGLISPDVKNSLKFQSEVTSIIRSDICRLEKFLENEQLKYVIKSIYFNYLNCVILALKLPDLIIE